ncbi:MAG: hypothetical protein KIS92_10650 [Planctomycetota bacterium]|nr:hypothetical protein [Planctomycetota bacterium]
MEPELFSQRLAETIAWCLPRAADPNDGLRTEALKPVLIHDRELPPDQRPDAAKAETWFQFLMGAGERSWADVVADLAARRIGELKKTQPDLAAHPNFATHPPDHAAHPPDFAARRPDLAARRPDLAAYTPDLTLGHLLFFEDDRSELDGASEQATGGYFNGCDVAPWDTWVAFVPKSPAQASALLISWVPPERLALVETGIAANETNCLWLTPCAPGLPELLAARAAHYGALDAAAAAASPPRKKRDFGDDA